MSGASGAGYGSLVERNEGGVTERAVPTLRAVESFLRQLPPADVLLGLAIVGASFAPFVVRPFLFGVPSPVALLLGFVAVAVRRRPALTTAATLLLVVLQPFPGDGLTPLVLTYVVVVYSLALYGGPLLRIASAVGAVVGGAYAAYDFSFAGGRLVAGIANDPDTRWPALVGPAAVLFVAWSVGLAVRLRRSAVAETALRQRAQRRAVDATESARTDRLRADMARNVHDVVGHSLAVIVAQADSAAFTDDPDELHRITGNIAAAARSSLHEVRDVLAGIDAEPSATDAIGLAEVVERLRETGLTVEHAVRGHRGRLAAREGAVARRIVQEMVANLLRHGDAAAVVSVRETWWPDVVVLEIENRTSPDAEPGSGRGLGNMAHRAREVDGAFETITDDERFVARVRLSVEGAADPDAAAPDGAAT